MGEELAIRRRDCLRCHKPKLLCICSWLGRIQHRTEVTILQDHRELKHAVGTSRLLRLGLGACSEYRVWRGKPLPDRALEDLQRADAILFPADDSQDLEEFISAKPLEHLVVLDGTWAQAKAMYKAYRPLRELPAVKLKLTVPGAYRLRKSQKEYYRSTVEAVWQALKVLEPENESLDKLLTWFERLQLEQERVAESRGVNPRSKIRRRPSHKVSRMLRERFSDLVAVYGEFFRFPNMGKDLVLAFICAYRFRDREVFHKFIRFTPHGSDFSALPLEHLKMFEPELDGAFSPDQLSQEWASWLPDETILVSWDSLPFRHPCGFPAHMVDRQISVKDVWYNNFRDRRGHVEDLARHYCRDQFYLGDDIEGRPKMRLEALITIVWYLMEHDRLIRVGSHTD